MTSDVTKPALPEVNPSARVVRVASPQASPGNCGLCGKYHHPDGFAFAGLDFESYGSLIFCADCVGDYAQVFGWMHPRTLALLNDRLNAQEKELVNLREAVLLLEDMVDGQQRLNELRDSRDNSASSVISSMEPQDSEDDESGSSTPDAGETDELPERTDSGLDESLSDGENDDAGTDESDDESGPDDVRDTSRLLADLGL